MSLTKQEIKELTKEIDRLEDTVREEGKFSYESYDVYIESSGKTIVFDVYLYKENECYDEGDRWTAPSYDYDLKMQLDNISIWDSEDNELPVDSGLVEEIINCSDYIT